ncbi:hypothetical protein L6164_024021 [Bauhinia variegata]|uniref:Uncharacterized protein n=1 Tax=Bauhinia variegata TaxID=167791 RepID=A0ACB9LXG1_BAUVA|nr:hypothetical protein L6164_024021 [Bauhinia variegata]
MFLDGTHPAPAAIITTEGTSSPNPAYLTWVRQDKLIFSAIVGTLSFTLSPLVSTSQTAKDATDILAQTFARPSRDHIKQLKDHLCHISKGSQTISEYMQAIKRVVDELALLGKPMDPEDIIDRVLDGLDPNYQSVVDTVHA